MTDEQWNRFLSFTSVSDKDFLTVSFISLIIFNCVLISFIELTTYAIHFSYA